MEDQRKYMSTIISPKANMKQEEAPDMAMEDHGGIPQPPPARSLVSGEYQYSSSRRILVAEAVRTSRANIKSSSTGTDTDRSLPMTTRPLPHIPINEEEAHHVDVVHGEDSWEAKVLHVLHSKTCQYTLMGLLLLDVVILFVELFLGAQYPACTFIIRDAVSCCPSVYAQEEHRSLGEASSLTCEAGGTETGDLHMLRSLAEVLADEGHHSLCEAGVDTPQCQAGCDPHKYDGVHTTHTALFFTTITILSIFMIELILLIVCLKPRIFFRKSFYVLDLFVVSVSLGLESFFYAADDETLQSLIGVIVLARCWRFVRIGQ